MGTPVALITGASAGIGREFARQLAAKGRNLLLTARREERLRELADDLREQFGIASHVIPCDLAARKAPEQLIEFAGEHNLDIDLLINNAGFGLRGNFHELDLPTQLKMVQVDVTSLMQLTHLALEMMIPRQHGTILNVASTAAFVPGPHMAVYYASKSFVLHFTEAIAEEVRGTGVQVSCLCPGPVKTEFGEVSGMSDSEVFKHASAIEPVVRKAIRGIERQKLIIIPGFANLLGTILTRFVPRFVVRRSVMRLQ